MFLTQLALQLIQVNSVIQSGNYSTDVQAGIMLAGNLWFPIMVGIGGVLFFVTPMVAQLYGARNLKEIGPLARQAIWLSIPIVLFGMFVSSQASWILTLAKVDPDIIFYSEEYFELFLFLLYPQYYLVSLCGFYVRGCYQAFANYFIKYSYVAHSDSC